MSYYLIVLTDQSEKVAALEDLVEGGANLLRTVDGLLRDIQTLGDIDIESKSIAGFKNC